jgi:hypothetical protein
MPGTTMRVQRIDIIDRLPEVIAVLLGEAASELPQFLVRDLRRQLDRGLLGWNDYILLREALSTRRRRLLDRLLHDDD